MKKINWVKTDLAENKMEHYDASNAPFFKIVSKGFTTDCYFMKSLSDTTLCGLSNDDDKAPAVLKESLEDAIIKIQAAIAEIDEWLKEE